MEKQPRELRIIFALSHNGQPRDLVAKLCELHPNTVAVETTDELMRIIRFPYAGDVVVTSDAGWGLCFNIDLKPMGVPTVLMQPSNDSSETCFDDAFSRKLSYESSNSALEARVRELIELCQELTA